MSRLLMTILAIFAQTALFAGVQNIHTYYEMCDASAAIPLDGKRFVVGDDEGNVLRVYERGGDRPVRTYDLSRFLIGRKKGKETDIEGAARVGDVIYWISSHGQNKDGKDAPNRHRLFGMRVLGGGAMLDPIGKTYNGLVADILGDKRFDKYGFAAASKLAPKAKGGLNIEGICARADGSLLIGFRNPVPNGKALVLPLLNPDKVVLGERAKLGDMIELDFGGLGVRDIAMIDGRILIVAGRFDTSKDFRLYEWDGQKTPVEIHGVKFGNMNPEAIFRFPGDPAGVYQFLSDDGGETINGRACKDCPKPQQRFRSGQFTLPQ